MNVVSNKALREFAALHAEAETPLQDFRRKMEKGSSANFAELRESFGTVDRVGDRYVFNIGGNKFRLIAWVQFDKRRCYVKAVLTHAEYDKGKWK